MEIINQKVELLKQEPGIEGIYKQIELAGRTAYKSENRITEDSAKKFVDMLINRKHNAALEHGIVYLKADIDTDYGQLLLNDFIGNPYTFYTIESGIIYLTTNYRVIIENNLEKYLKSLCNPTTRHKRSYTFRITTSRAIANEIVRHRVFSFMQESTRYISYSSKRSLKEFNCDSESDICKAYTQGFSMKNISDLSSFSEWGIRKILLKNNIEIRGLNNKGNRIEDYFKVIDSPEKAYLLGIIQTDGNVRISDRNAALVITQHKDYYWYIKYMLQLFSDYVSETKDKNCKQLQIGSKQIVSDLISIGIVPNKTKVQSNEDIQKLWDSIPIEYKGDFIRGCIDGDGHVSYFIQKNGVNESCNIGLCSTKELLIDLIIDYIQSNFKYLCNKSKDGNVYKLAITSIDKAKEIGLNLYKHFKYPFGHPKKSSIWLNRLNINPSIAKFKDDKFICIKPSRFESFTHFAKFTYIKSLVESEDAYIKLRLSGLKPEIARGVLPLDLKTELIVTGMEWDNFFKLRCAKDAHPDIQIIANKIKNIIKDEENPKKEI